jgi:hypothetical protein
MLPEDSTPVVTLVKVSVSSGVLVIRSRRRYRQPSWLWCADVIDNVIYLVGFTKSGPTARSGDMMLIVSGEMRPCVRNPDILVARPE